MAKLQSNHRFYKSDVNPTGDLSAMFSLGFQKLMLHTCKWVRSIYSTQHYRDGDES